MVALGVQIELFPQGGEALAYNLGVV